MAIQQLGASMAAVMTSSAWAELTAKMAALESTRPMGTTGEATITANLLAGQSLAVPVTFSRPLPNTNYAVFLSIDGAASLLGALIPQYPVSAKSTTGCTVTVRNSALVALGQSATVRVAAINL